MQVAKLENQIAIRLEEKKSMLEIGAVISGVSEGELRIARLSLKTPIGGLPMEGDKGLPQQAKMLSIGICRDYAIRGVTDLETFRFMDILKKYYGGMTLDEVRTAFELALVGSLDEFLPKDRNGQPDKNSYQIFSVEFITKILGAYRRYKGRIWTKVYKCSEKEDKPVTAEEKGKIDNDLRDTIQGVYAEYLETGMLNAMFTVFICNYFVKLGRIKDREVSKMDINKAIQILAIEEKNSEERKKIFDSLEGDADNRVLAMAERVKSRELILELFGKMKDAKKDNIWN